MNASGLSDPNDAVETLRGADLLIHADSVLTDPHTGVRRDGQLLAVRNGQISGFVDIDRLQCMDPALRPPVERHAGCTLLPGLIDTHVHSTLFADGRGYAQMDAESDALIALVGSRNLTRHLLSGVTTVRDNGSRGLLGFDLREGAARDYFLAPRMLVSGAPITHTQGHFWWCGAEADGPQAVAGATRRVIAQGADHVKIMASGGETDRTLPQYSAYSVEELRCAVSMAHDFGRLTTAHCRSADAMVRAIDAGVDCIEHAEFLIPRVGDGPAPTQRDCVGVYNPEIVERLVSSGTSLSFTLQEGGYDRLLELKDRQSFERLTSREAAEVEALEQKYRDKGEILRQLFDAGMSGRISISTDAGVGDTRFGVIATALDLAVRSGVAHTDVLGAVTSSAARICGLGERVGVLRPGAQADLVVVEGDPLQDMRAMSMVRSVYLGGSRVTSPGLT